jgi:CelD/BcsL family acetyltransferase involved in cellulose biosynthesis
VDVELHSGGIEQLLPEWEALFREDPEATPFVSAQWAQAWWPHWAGTARPWVLTAREGGRLVALAPLVLRHRGPFRVISELGRDPSNYWSVVASPQRRAGAAAAIARAVAERSREWDAVILGGITQGEPVVEALAGRGLRIQRRAPVPHPGIELPSSFDDYLASLPRKRRKDLRRHLRRLDEGELSYRPVEDPAELEAAMARWQELRVRWWRARGKRLDPEHAGPRFRNFVGDLMALTVPRGLGQVWEFRSGQATVGIEISLLTQRSFYAWLDGYDPDFAHLGLGKVAAGEAIRTSIANGRDYFDFMVGAEEYKYWFGATDRFCQWAMATRAGLRSRAAAIAGTALGLIARRRRWRARESR